MRAKALSILLLLLLGFSLSAGAHPCGEGKPAGQGHAAAAPPCHGSAPAGDHEESESTPHRCPHFCHAAAVAPLVPTLSEAGPAAALTVAESKRSLPPVAQPIDHIPLN